MGKRQTQTQTPLGQVLTAAGETVNSVEVSGRRSHDVGATYIGEETASRIGVTESPTPRGGL